MAASAGSRKFGIQGDWDPMRDDFDNNNYQAQHQDDGSSDFVKLDHCRLYITGIPKVLTDDGLRTVFSKYGPLKESYVSPYPNKRFALVMYETPAEARHAMMKLNKTEPLNLCISIAHEGKNNKRENANNRSGTTSAPSRERNDSHTSNRDCDTSSYTSRIKSRKTEDLPSGVMEDVNYEISDEPDLQMELEKLQLESIRLKQEELACQQRLLIKQSERKAMGLNSQPANRCVLPNGRTITVVKTVNGSERRDENNFTAPVDSNERDGPCVASSFTSDGSSTPSTTKEIPNQTKLLRQCQELFSRTNDSEEKSETETFTKKDSSQKKSDISTAKPSKTKSTVTCDAKYSNFYVEDEEDELDETNRIIQLRNTDYANVVDEQLKIVVAQAGYPKLKMRLQQMAIFQKCLNEVTDMQVKAGLLKRLPAFFDYYLNRGAIVCICRDVETRDWLVRIRPGLQERMLINLILLKAKVKRMCLAKLKIPQSCWPATAQDAFKLLQYFNPELKTNLWKIYSQKNDGNVDTTYFMIDRVSGEIMRGPSFQNVIEYNQIDLDLTGYTEMYYECFLSDFKVDVSSVASRIKLLEEIKSETGTPRDGIEMNVVHHSPRICSLNETETDLKNNKALSQGAGNFDKVFKVLHNEDMKTFKDVQYIREAGEANIWSDTTKAIYQEVRKEKTTIAEEQYNYEDREYVASAFAVSEKTESIADSNDNYNPNRNLLIESNRGIAYHRRTNYLHVEPQLKIAVALDGYPQDKLEGSHIRRLKHLFKEHLHKDLKNHRFPNMIIPKFQDIYLSNGAVIYICDSLETKEYLLEVMPKIINSTGLKLVFKDIKDLVRYTRVVMRLPKEYAHVESLEILMTLQATYPSLKFNCWKYYSDVAGKQKRQFGVDPESLQVIRSPDFDPTFEGQKISFRIIDRQKRDSMLDEKCPDISDQSSKCQKLRETLVRSMYVPIDQESMNSLTRIRSNHYSDLVDDDLKLYVGPEAYPESRIDDILFHSIKRTLENVVLEALENEELTEDRIPQIHDIYLFDGVIFIICVNMDSRIWIEENLNKLNGKLGSKLKCTEFRGAVGIISMCVKTSKSVPDVFQILQEQNPRLRTQFWRTISTVRTKDKLDVVLQIDKLSAQVMTCPEFNKFVNGSPIQFELGHLRTLLKQSKNNLASHQRKLTQKKSNTSLQQTRSKVVMQGPKDKNIGYLMHELCKEYPALKVNDWNVLSLQEKVDHQVFDLEIDEDSAKFIEKENFNLSLGDVKVFFYSEGGSPVARCVKEKSSANQTEQTVPQDWSSGDQIVPKDCNSDLCKIILKIPMKILPENKEDLSIIFDLLEDKNPGLNTELWKVFTDAPYPNNGKFTLFIDKQSVSVIEGKNFDPTVGGQALKFYF